MRHASPLRAGATALLCALPAGWAGAGAWTQGDGDALVIFTTDTMEAGRAFDDDGDRSLDTEFAKLEARLYGEWGLRPGVTLFAQSAIQQIDFVSKDGPARFTGVGDSRAGARVGLWSPGRHRLAVSGDLGWQASGEFLADGELDRDGLSSEWRALWGYGGDRFYLDAQAGWRTRFSDGPDTWVADAGAGWALTRRWTLAGSAHARLTGGEMPSERNGADRVLATRSLKLKAAGVYRLDRRMRVELGWVQTVAGRNHVAEGGLTAALWREF